MDELARRVAEASTWWQRRAVATSAYRDAPPAVLDVDLDLLMAGPLPIALSSSALDARRLGTVEGVVRRRRERLKAATPHADRGRVLSFDLSGCFHDGVAQEMSDGFFDEDDLPPPDLWLAYRAERTTLYAWVPADVTVRVERAVRAHLVDAYRWPSTAELDALRALLRGLGSAR